MNIKDRFSEAFAENKDMYYRIALSFMGNEDEAIDAVCEMSLKAWEKLSFLRNEDSFKSWSTSILVNICRTRLKQRGRVAELTENEPAPSEDIDRKIAVRTAVDKLPVKLREVVILRYYNGFDINSVARTLMLPHGTVKSRLSRAMDTLERELGDLR